MKSDDKLAIQWDVAVEFGVLEGVWPVPFENLMDGIVERIVRISGHVPSESRWASISATAIPASAS